MSANKDLKKSRLKYTLFLTCYVLACLSILVVIVLLIEGVIPPMGLKFISVFYFDLLYLLLLTFTVVYFRQLEMNVLVDLQIYRNIDKMTDREMFEEYEKLFKQAKRMRRRHK